MAHSGRFERQTIGGKVKAALTMGLYPHGAETMARKQRWQASRPATSLSSNADRIRPFRDLTFHDYLLAPP